VEDGGRRSGHSCAMGTRVRELRSVKLDRATCGITFAGATLWPDRQCVPDCRTINDARTLCPIGPKCGTPLTAPPVAPGVGVERRRRSRHARPATTVNKEVGKLFRTSSLPMAPGKGCRRLLIADVRALPSRYTLTMSPDDFLDAFQRARASAILRTPLADAAGPALTPVRAGPDRPPGYRGNAGSHRGWPETPRAPSSASHRLRLRRPRHAPALPASYLNNRKIR